MQRKATGDETSVDLRITGYPGLLSTSSRKFKLVKLFAKMFLSTQVTGAEMHEAVISE